MSHTSSLSKKLLLLTLLTSVTALTACGKKEEAKPVTPPSSSLAAKVVSQPSSSVTTITSTPSSSVIGVTTPSAMTEAEVEEEVNEVSSEEEVTQEESATPQTEAAAEVASPVAPAEGTALPTTFDVYALSSEDYSSIAGTWANAEGLVFTVTAEGILYFGETFDENAHHKIEQTGLNKRGRVSGSLGFYRDGERAGGATIIMVPAGVANTNDLVGDIDHIEIGHDVSAGYPENQFFRQSSQ